MGRDGRQTPGPGASSTKARILNALLDRYERSRSFLDQQAEKNPVRRIAFRPEAEKAFAGLLEDTNERRRFLSAARDLQEEGLIGYEWVRFEKGNLIERIWLITGEEALARSYALAGRTAKADQIHTLKGQLLRTRKEIKKARGEEGEETDLERFLLETEHHLEEKKSIPRFFFRGEKDESSALLAAERNEKLLRFLAVMATNREEMLERVVSTRLFGDSKYFERELKSHVLSILRSLAAWAEESKDDSSGEANARLLEERGIMKWPEILEFCGAVRIRMDTGCWLDFSGQIYGACINSDTVRHALEADLSGTRQILTIENKANYTWYIANERREGELVLYHGGAFSPIKGRWMKLLAAAAAGVSCRHWSDIDLGGFRIFARLKKEVFPSLQPEKMDLLTLMRFRDSCIEIENEKYLEKLLDLAKSPEYEPFYELIGRMVSERVRLEQEAEI